MIVLFTDLDGTLLDHETYSWEAARPAIEDLRARNVPWIFVTSKTRAETEFWRVQTGNQHPFVVENGGAAYVPPGYFQAPAAGAIPRQDYEVLEWGAPYEELVNALSEASRRSNCAVRGFNSMSIQEVAASCGLSEELGALAKQREYDEPFEILEPQRADALAQEIASQGYRYTRGGRFHHIIGNNDKGAAVRALTELFRRGADNVRTIGLGDAVNDVPLLSEVAIPVLMQSPQLERLRQHFPGALVALEKGPAGWNQMVRFLIGAGETEGS